MTFHHLDLISSAKLGRSRRLGQGDYSWREKRSEMEAFFFLESHNFDLDAAFCRRRRPLFLHGRPSRLSFSGRLRGLSIISAPAWGCDEDFYSGKGDTSYSAYAQHWNGQVTIHLKHLKFMGAGDFGTEQSMQFMRSFVGSLIWP